MRRNLVIVRAGDNSLHTAWLVEEPARNWDIIVSYYGDDPNLYRDKGQRRIDEKGPKWPPLHRLVGTLKNEITAYDYVWFPDDDLVCDAASINRFFDICHEFSLELCQPSLTLDSIAGHIITLTNKSFRLRYTNFVEIMAPCFSKAFLEKCWPSFTRNTSGWGLDFLWPTWASDPSKIAVIDEVSVRHTRARGKLYTVLHQQGKTPEQDMAELIAAENLSMTKVTRGGISKNGELYAIWNDNRKKLIESLIAGYLPELGNYPQHIFSSIEPLIGKD